MSVLRLAMLMSLLAFSTADDQIETCANSAGSACQRRSQVVFSDYAPDKAVEDEEEEDMNEGDLNMHMQMKLNIEIPLEDKDKGVKHSLGGAAKSIAQSPEGVTSSNSGSAAGKQPAAPPMPAAIPGSELPEAIRPAATYQVDPAAFVSGYQLLVGAGIGGLLVLSGAVMATVLRAWSADRKLPVKQEELQNPAELKMFSKKKQPPIHSASDSGDTDEEEPEAESDSAMEDAVFIAEQVEVANEAVDQGYGMEREARLADVICCDPR